MQSDNRFSGQLFVGAHREKSRSLQLSKHFLLPKNKLTYFKMSPAFVLATSALLVAMLHAGPCAAKNPTFFHWNKQSPVFRIDNTDHIVDVEEYDQVNLICPTSKPGARYPEKHVIYSVSREEYQSCRITNPKPKIVAICNQPHKLMYFTITFRSFTPTPGGLEFHPGHDYYFISTSSRDDLHRRVGGGCSTHNMKMIFKVRDNTAKQVTGLGDHLGLDEPAPIEEQDTNSLSSSAATATSSTTTTRRPVPGVIYNTRVPNHRGEYIYYYHPRDLIELENNVSPAGRKRQRVNHDLENDVLWKNEALRYTDPSSGASHRVGSVLFAILPAFVLLVCSR